MSSLVDRWFVSSLLVPASAAMYYCTKLTQAYPRLAASIPVHFDFHGSPNSWMSKSAWAPLSLAFIFAMMAGIPSILHVTGQHVTGQHGSRLGPLIYFGVYGLLIGAFLELLSAAQSEANLRLLPLVAWTIAMTAVQGFILFVDSV